SDLLVKKDAIRLYDTLAQYRAEESERADKREYGYEPRRLSAGEISEIEPDVAKDFACGAFHGGWYYVRNPHKVVASIAEQVVRNGGEILQDEVLKVTQDGSRAIALTLQSTGERPLNQLVICAGAYSNFFAQAFGDKVLLEAERGYHLMMPDP